MDKHMAGGTVFHKTLFLVFKHIISSFMKVLVKSMGRFIHRTDTNQVGYFRQTVQTQIRLLLKKQSDQGDSCLLFWRAIREIQPWKTTFWEQKEENVNNFKYLP